MDYNHFPPTEFQILLEEQKNTNHKLETIMSALSDLQAADAAIDSEVSAVLADLVTLQNTINSLAANPDSADVETVVADLQAQAANIIAALTPPAPPAPVPVPVPVPASEPEPEGEVVS